MKKMAVMDYTMSAIFIPHYSDFCYFVQKARVNRISTVNSSRRPINMSMARIHLHISGIAGRPPVLPVSDTSPMLDTHEKELKNASTSDIPHAVRAMPPMVIIIT